jgi:hypothetical protein
VRTPPLVIEVGEGNDAEPYVRADVFRDAIAALRRAHNILDATDAHTDQTKRDRDRLTKGQP